MARILVAEDEEGVRSFLAEALGREGHAVTTARDGAEAAAALERQGVDLLLTDLRMPGLDGMALLTKVKAEQPDVEVVVLTAHGSIESAVAAMKAGAFDYLTKPVGSPAELRLVVARALERRALLNLKAQSHQPAVPPLTFGAPAMREVVSALRKVARTQATLLLLGESGTGKEVAARAAHAWSDRAEGPFVAVSCAAIPEALLESELFGHERGAFTGATSQRRGRLELAQGGTFFLDEVGELKAELQAKLLRVLQEQRFERVGGTRTLEADVRWIAATNRDLKAMMAAGDFREDLYHRLAVFPVVLPPLRERREDVRPLSTELLKAVAEELGRPGMTLAEGAAARLAQFHWPGNVRELRNVLERAVILAEGPVIEERHLWLDAPSQRLLLDGLGGSGAVRPPRLPDVPLEELERLAIEQAIAAEGGNRKRAAARLGLGLRTLYEKLRRYGGT